MGTHTGSVSDSEIMQIWILLACLVPALARSPGEHIVGGRDVQVPGTYPHQASLEFRSSGSHTCGAVLISTQYLVCAAHCVGSGASAYQIVLGQHDRTTRNQGNPQIYAVSSLTRHPQYPQDGSRGFPNDISVIQLSTEATLNSFTQTVDLAPANAPDYSGYTCYITGWGRLYGFGPLPNVLQEAQIDVLTESECRTYWGSRIVGYHICVGDLANGQKGACNGEWWPPGVPGVLWQIHPGWRDLLGPQWLFHLLPLRLRPHLLLQGLDQTEHRCLSSQAPIHGQNRLFCVMNVVREI